jgi:hypothetical protein
MTTSWLKSEDGKDWSVRVEGEAIDPAVRPSRASVFYHFGLEGLGDLGLEKDVDKEVGMLRDALIVGAGGRDCACWVNASAWAV